MSIGAARTANHASARTSWWARRGVRGEGQVGAEGPRPQQGDPGRSATSIAAAMMRACGVANSAGRVGRS